MQNCQNFIYAMFPACVVCIYLLRTDLSILHPIRTSLNYYDGLNILLKLLMYFMR